MKVLVACEESQTVCKAFRKRGHEAYSCDIQECSGGHPEWHIQGDVLPLLKEKWDLIIAHPPCQFLTNTGNPYLNVEKWGEKAIQRAKDREKAFEFFMRFANADCDKICIENPIGYPNTHYRKPNQIIQPWQFGHPFAKATCLWLKGLEPLKPFVTEKPKNCKSYAWETMIDERGKTISWNSELSRKLRSKTFEGIAEAMAEQWGNHPTEKGDKGKKGMIGVCPNCGKSDSITWNSRKDVCFCSCGWDNDHPTEKGGDDNA